MMVEGLNTAVRESDAIYERSAIKAFEGCCVEEVGSRLIVPAFIPFLMLEPFVYYVAPRF